MLNLRCMAYVLSVSVIWCNIEALQKKMLFKMIKKCLKKVKTFEWPVLPYSFSPVDYSVMKTVWHTQNLISIFNHKYLDNQTDDRLVKVIGFLTDLKVYIYTAAWAKSRILLKALRQSYRIPLRRKTTNELFSRIDTVPYLGLSYLRCDEWSHRQFMFWKMKCQI